jgi:hypothetical protein
MVLEKFGSNNTIFMKDSATVESALELAKQKMDELK